VQYIVIVILLTVSCNSTINLERIVACPLQQCLSEITTMLRYTYIACLLYHDFFLMLLFDIKETRFREINPELFAGLENILW
jgi:hypothetical protein